MKKSVRTAAILKKLGLNTRQTPACSDGEWVGGGPIAQKRFTH